MFKSTKEIDTALVEVLSNIQEGIYNYQDSYDFDYDDFNEVIRHALQRGYVTGYAKIQFVAQKPGYKAMNPEVTYAGIRFIENN